ncbi:zinc finger protein 60-like [Chironomus tepperi]|uniref:zinc finger protein 60-like n=1 Tax=Chironomus tepperi TaxID=113505 RepID=UPI00391F3778
MSAKITNFFKVKPKSSSKIGEDETIPTKIRECQVMVTDIKHQFGNNELKLFEEISSNQKNKNENNICKHCGKKLSSKYCLKVHMKNIHPNELSLFECEICNRRFLGKHCMEAHIKKKHPNGQIDQFECDFDGKIFKTKRLLNIHMGCHFPLVECQICHKMLKYLCMRAHLKNFHATGKNFNCNICDQQFKSKNYLNIHEKIHDKKFECEICNKMYTSKGTLNKHKKNVHKNPGSFECEICGKKFNRAGNLKNHQKTHNKNRPKSLQCQRCDYATDIKYDFKNHQNFHERQDAKFALMKNPLKCEKCPTFCKDNYALNAHMRNAHPKELFQCDLCAKFLKKKSTLIYHINTHISGRYEGGKN